MSKKNNVLNNSQENISREPFPNSRKIYIKGSVHPNVRVGMREIEISESDNFFSSNPTNTYAHYSTYDTSGPYTDSNVQIDITKGLDKLREKWILARGDVEEAKSRSKNRRTKKMLWM